MKKKDLMIIFFALLPGVPCLTIAVYAACALSKSHVERYNNCFAGDSNSDVFEKIADFTLSTREGPYNLSTSGKGAGCIQARDNGQNLCYPLFYTETWADVDENLARFYQETRNVSTCQGSQPIYYTAVNKFEQDLYCEFPTPTPEPTATPPGGECEEYGAGWFPGNNGRTCVPPECSDCYGDGGSYCSQTGACWTPVVIDLDGNGFNLTNASEGVLFAPDSSGQLLRTGWTAAHSDDAFLVLDRNGNALIDDGTELFGSASPQPAPPVGQLRHGFLALALYDRPEHGGNNDNRIDAADSIFARLKLWQDRNHNGISEAHELQALSASPVRVVELDYRESRRTDEHGNGFRYRAKVRDARGAQVGRWAWDVFPVSAP